MRFSSRRDLPLPVLTRSSDLSLARNYSLRHLSNAYRRRFCLSTRLVSGVRWFQEQAVIKSLFGTSSKSILQSRTRFRLGFRQQLLTIPPTSTLKLMCMSIITKLWSTLTCIKSETSLLFRSKPQSRPNPSNLPSTTPKSLTKKSESTTLADCSLILMPQREWQLI